MNNFFALNNLSELEIRKLIEDISGEFDFMNQGFPQVNSRYAELFLKNKIDHSVTFFGGTFDPFHDGHLECLKQCPEKNIVLVLDRNPHKELREIDQLTELQSMAKKLLNTHYSIYPGFWLKNSKNPTSEWISKINLPEVNLLMGDDSFINFFKWKNPEVIINRISKIYILPRNFEKDILLAQEKKFLEINSKLEIFFLQDHIHQDLSSTKLRVLK